MALFRLIKTIGLAVGVGFSLSACGILSNDSRYDPAPLTEYAPSATGQIVWSTKIGSGSGYGFAPIVSADSVFAASPDGSVVRVNLSNGQTVWSNRLSERLSGGVGVGDGLLAVTTENGQVIALDATTGKQLWAARTSTISSNPPVIGNGVVVVRADDFRVQAFEANGGALKWSFVRTNPELSLRTNVRMSILGNMVVVALPTGRLVAVDLNTGRPAWELIAATVKGPTDLDGVTDVVGLPIVVDNHIYMSSYQGNVLSYDFGPRGAQLQWAQPFSSAVGVDVTQSAVLAASMDGTVAAFQRNNGERVWANDALRNRGLTNPISLGSYVLVGDYEGLVHILNFNNGELQGRFALGGSDAIVSPLIATPNGVIAQTGSGNLVLFGVK